MNYQRVYNALIQSRLKRVTSTVDYYEKHHILPKSLGGSDDDSNLVKLTAREHYLAHWLLTKINPECEKMWTAFALMSGRMSPMGSRVFSDKAYERCKKAQSVATKIRMAKGWNPGRSEKSKQKAKDRMLNKNPIKQDPGKNWTARGVEVYFTDGRIEFFAYGKLGADSLGIPYTTWKWALKNTGGRIPKYNVQKILQSSPKTSNKKFEACEG